MTYPGTRIANFTGAVAGAVFALIASGIPAGWHVSFGLLGIDLWAILPYLSLFLLGYLAREYPMLMASMVASLVCTAGAFLVYGDMLRHSDPQEGLLFLFVPLYQLGIALVAFIIGRLVTMWKRRHMVAR